MQQNWEEIRRQAGPVVWAAVYRILRNHDQALDCYQEVFLEAFEQSKKHVAHDWPAYLRWLAVRRALDRLRKERRAAAHISPDDDVASCARGPEPCEDAEFRELVERVRLEMARLPDRKPIDTRALVVSPTKGVGPVPMKASEDEVIAFFGTPDWIETLGRFPKSLPAPGKAIEKAEAGIVHKMLHYYSLGFEMQVSGEGGITQFHCLPESSLARKFLGKTDAGITLGASVDEVIQVYGAPEVKDPHRQEVLYYRHKGWSFIFSDGKLASFTASPPVPDEIEVIDHGDGSWTERAKLK